MSRHSMPITKEIAPKVRQLVIGFDRPLGSCFFQVYAADRTIEDPINDCLTEYFSLEDLVEAVNYFLGNLIGKTYQYPFSAKFFVQLMKEASGKTDTNTCRPWRD